MRKKNLRKVHKHISMNHKRTKLERFKFLIIKEKKFIVSIVGALIALGTFLFIYFTYKSPSHVVCKIDFIQRPDSLYQAQLYIWNDGGQIAENVQIWLKKEEVFLWDTSGNHKKGRLNIFPRFNTYSRIAPSQYLDDAGRRKTNYDHQIILPQLPPSNKKNNYLIIGPNVGRNNEELIRLKSLPSSIYRFKFINLGHTKGINSYIEEILENTHILQNGSGIDIDIGKIISLNEYDSTDYYFPTFKEFEEYQSKANLPNNLMPPFNQDKNLIKKLEDDRNDDFSPPF
jgi:hypothetical protein